MNGTWRFVLALPALLTIVLGTGACSVLDSNSGTPVGTRAATQTPWIVYVPVTSTPEPATVTPLPTVTTSVRSAATATRTATRAAAVAATKPPAAPATKPPVAPPVAPTSAAAVAPTAAPACTQNPVKTLLFPQDGSPRTTKQSGPGSDTFRFQWEPIQPNEMDLQIGYRIDIASRRGNTQVNGDTVYVGHNWFINNGRTWVYDARRVYGLAAPAGGDSVNVTWRVTVVRTTGGFDNQGGATGTVVACSPASPTFTIVLNVIE